jgi:hypothetical protein
MSSEEFERWRKGWLTEAIDATLANDLANEGFLPMEMVDLLDKEFPNLPWLNLSATARDFIMKEEMVRISSDPKRNVRKIRRGNQFAFCKNLADVQERGRFVRKSALK